MKRAKLLISASKLTQLQNKLLEFEATYEPIKIGKLNLSSFLKSNIIFADDTTTDLYIRVNSRILHIAGDYTSDPTKLRGSTNLKNNLGYSDLEYRLLQSSLDKLVKEYL